MSGDIDGNGRDDIVMASRFNGTTDTGKPTRFFVIRQSSAGTLLPVQEFLYPRTLMFTSQMRLAVADVDNDGREDAVLGGDKGILVLSYKPGSGFTVSEPIVDVQCHHIVLTDINLDGSPDIACLRERFLSFLFGEGNGGFAGSSSIDLLSDGWVDLKAADVNGDGFEDLLLLRDSVVSEMLVFPHDGVGGFAPPDSHPMPPNEDDPGYGQDVSSWGMSIGDFNNDGLADVAASTTNRLPALFHVLYQTPGASGPLFLNREVSIPQIPSAFAVADFDRDGDDDIFARFSAGAIWHAVFIGQDNGRLVVGESVTSAPSMPPYDHSTSTAVGDVNGDGCPDVLTVDGFALWINFAEGCFRRETGGRGFRRKL